MRGAPPCRFEVVPLPAWRGFVLAVATAAGAAPAAWWLASVTGGSATRPWTDAVAVLAIAGAIGLGIVSWRGARGRLDFDGMAWAWLPATGRGAAVDAARDEPPAGDVAVHVDLGRFLLLRWRPAAVGRVSRRSGAAWLPVARGDDEAAWHALRHAVFAGRAALPAGRMAAVE